MNLLRDLESLKLIKLRRENVEVEKEVNWSKKYKGAMTKQTNTEVDEQLNQLRGEWE